jgi:hypothetical protein
MTTNHQLRLALNALEARVRKLEAAVEVQKRRRTRAPRPDAGVIREREELWSKYLMLEMSRGHCTTKLSKLGFATKNRINPSEFARWFSAADARGIAEGSGPDTRIRRALAEAIAELGARLPSARGKLLASQFSG